MKVNANTVIVGRKVVLVPYGPEHVPKYHQWMLNDELRELTASEQLSLEEEYEMQRKWQIDEDKLTFIILAKESSELLVPPEGLLPDSPLLSKLPMVGDVNIFLYGSRLSLEIPPACDTEDSEDGHSYAEVEIMIAENSYRRGGFATEALQLMLGYATGQPQSFFGHNTVNEDTKLFAAIPPSPLCISPFRLVSRIGSSNEPSVNLFRKLGFQVTKRIEVFDELEMRYLGDPGTLATP
ncbi:GNAT domain-containing protein [Crepidotus variabilis]|uniref:GNAT domain-containing protein n=1 Tax=Crepidotus variabilis TaxID=179855 RepID=A0A9P6E503_9AGAR|nr:GNAT domain-containing protein [Crepidotus variabilis]